MNTELMDGLRATRALVVARGWTQGAYEHEGKLCLGGAARLATGATVDEFIGRAPAAWDVLAAIDATLGARGEWPISSIPWNDVGGRTQAEVLALIDATLERVAAQATTETEAA